jgi:hypothetical protein
MTEETDGITVFIRDYGRVVTHTYATDDEPGFSHSIGFPVSLQQPEVIIFGLSEELMHFMINDIWRQASEGGLKLEDGAQIGGLLKGFDCVAREMTDRAFIDDHLAEAGRYHERKGNTSALHRAFQIVWPDSKRGLYPWDAGCPKATIQRQPALYSKSSNS